MGRAPGRPARRPSKEEVESFLAYPVLMAVARGPKTLTEIARALQLSKPRVKVRLKELEKEGWVIQRASDWRWVMRVVLRAEGMPELVALPLPGEPAVVRTGKPEGTAYKAVGEAQRVEVGSQAVEPPSSVPGGVLLLAAKYQVPADIPELGLVRIALGANCTDCGQLTRLRWGTTPLCQGCAQGWAKGVTNVHKSPRGDSGAHRIDVSTGTGAVHGPGSVREDGGGDGGEQGEG